MSLLDGVQDHIDAVARGERVEERIRLLRGSNLLDDEGKRVQEGFLKSFCLAAALEPYCDSEIDLGDGLRLRLNKARRDLENGELPGVRVDSFGDLVIEGDFIRDGKEGKRFDKYGLPRWPLIVRNAPVFGSGPWENFREQVFEVLRQAGSDWPTEP